MAENSKNLNDDKVAVPVALRRVNVPGSSSRMGVHQSRGRPRSGFLNLGPSYSADMYSDSGDCGSSASCVLDQEDAAASVSGDSGERELDWCEERVKLDKRKIDTFFSGISFIY